MNQRGVNYFLFNTCSNFSYIAILVSSYKSLHFRLLRNRHPVQTNIKYFVHAESKKKKTDKNGTDRIASA